MSYSKLYRGSELLIEHLAIANGFSARSRGLLGRRDLPDDEGLLIPRCQMVHMFFMSFPIDIVFLDEELRVRAIRPNLKPWRISSYRFDTDSILEVSVGSVARLNITPGQQLRVVES
ncbi:MAG: DUF192 domain-containing protein [Deltaproteobacteria bacterium]|nr:DUF192 domain-containing protein [Deltaproteobacteria bacterium]